MLLSKVEQTSHIHRFLEYDAVEPIVQARQIGCAGSHNDRNAFKICASFGANFLQKLPP